MIIERRVLSGNCMLLLNDRLTRFLYIIDFYLGRRKVMWKC